MYSLCIYDPESDAYNIEILFKMFIGIDLNSNSI